MKIALFGATGTLGLPLLQAALAAGHEVTVLARAPEKLGAEADRCRVIAGDYLDASCRAAALAGAEAVLSTIGPPMKRAPNAGEYARAMGELIGQMQDAGIARIIAVGGAGLRLGAEKLPLPRAVMRQILRLRAGKGYDDKEREHNALCASELDWTILRPPQLAPTPGALVVSQDGPAAFRADPVQVAQYMVACLEDAQAVRSAPFVAMK